MFGEHRREWLKQECESKGSNRLLLRPLNGTMQSINRFPKDPCVVCKRDGVKGISESRSSAIKLPEPAQNGAQTEIRMPALTLRSDRSDW